MKKIILPISYFLVLILSGCSKSNWEPDTNEVIREFILPLAARNSIPVTSGRTESGELRLRVLDNNSIRFDFLIDEIQSGDAITKVQLHSGDPLSTGPMILDLNPRIANNYGSGVVVGVRSSLIDSLRRNDVDLYVNISSSRVPGGLIRTQLNNPVIFSADVPLTGSSVNPAVTTTASGTATIRLTEDKRLYSNVSVTNLEPNDQLTGAHIHRGALGTNGAMLITLASSGTQFGTNTVRTLADAEYQALLRDPLYVLVTSTNRSVGVLRGQIR